MKEDDENDELLEDYPDDEEDCSDEETEPKYDGIKVRSYNSFSDKYRTFSMVIKLIRFYTGVLL